MSTETVLARLVSEGVLSAEQAAVVRTALAEDTTGRAPARWVAEVAGYVGGVLMLGGAAFLLATQWERLSDVARGLSLTAVTVVIIGAALIVGGRLGPLRAGESPARRRVVGVLFALASVTGALAAGAFVGGGHAAVIAGSAGLLIALAGYAVLPTAPGLVASATMSGVLGGTLVDDVFTGDPGLYAAAFLVAGVAWGVATFVGYARPEALGFGLAGVLALIGAQQPLAGPNNVWAYGLTALVALGSFALYRWRRSPVLLVGGVVGVAIAAPEAVWDLTDGTAGGALILLVAGAALVAASAVGLRLWRSEQ